MITYLGYENVVSGGPRLARIAAEVNLPCSVWRASKREIRTASAMPSVGASEGYTDFADTAVLSEILSCGRLRV